MLKLDKEGAEQKLFSAEDLSWLDHIGAIVIEPHDWMKSGCSQAIYRALVHWEFDQFTKGENVFIVRRDVA